MSKKPESSSQEKERSKPRKATMTSHLQLLLGRKLLLKASGAHSLQERARVAHARIWKRQEIKKHFTREYMEEQLARAHRQNQWLGVRLKNLKKGT